MLKDWIAGVLVTLAGGDTLTADPGEWYWAKKDGYLHYMPPLECRVGPLPPYRVHELPFAEMDKRFNYRTFANIPLGWYVPPHDGETEWQIYLAKELPAGIKHDVFVHELAHLRGCHHEGEY